MCASCFTEVGSYTKQTSSVKINASNAHSAISYSNVNVHTTNMLTAVRFLKLAWVASTPEWIYDSFSGGTEDATK